MAIDFPNSPSTNATYTVGNKTWIYDGTTWNTYNSTTFSAETLPGTTIKSTVTGSSLTSVGTLGSLAVTAGVTAATFTGALAGNVTGNVSGTAATVTGAAQTAITSVGTLTGLTIGGAGANRFITINAPSGYYAIQYFAINGTNKWHYEVDPAGTRWSLVESGVAERIGVTNAGATFSGTVTATTFSGSGTSLTTLNASNISSGTLDNLRLPAAATTITSVGTLTGLTTSGQVAISRGALGTTAGNEISFINPNATTTNSDFLDTRLIRNSNGSDWTTAVWRMGRLVDTTRMGFIQFGDGAGAQDVRLGVGTTTYGTINTSGLFVTNEIYATSNIRISTAGANFIAQSPSTGSGNAAQWVSAFGLYILYRNTSTRDDKENFQPLNGVVTPNMIDDIEISLWNRKGATGFPEIGPMAEDMDEVSPFLSIRGMDCDEEGNIVATAPSGINQNSWLSLLTIALQDSRKRIAELENIIRQGLTNGS